MESQPLAADRNGDCLIIGASVRAAAESATRCGFRVIAADLFSDRDTQAVASCVRVRDYPQGLLSVRAEHIGLPVVYTGALENHPAIIDRAAQLGPLWGNDATVLRRVRDPFLLASVLEKNALPFARTSRKMGDASVTWLRKSFRSAGGQNITYAAANQPSLPGYFYQQHFEGTVCSASYVASGGVARMIGVTDMLVGQEWLGASGFAYCGSVLRAPNPHELKQWQTLGQVLAGEFQLVGVFGVDAVVREHQVIPIEVNPRYTASMEVLERAGIVSVFQEHVNACLGQSPIDVNKGTGITGKAILYAAKLVVIPTYFPKPSAEGVRLADLPVEGESIQSGRPVLTILAEDPTYAGVSGKLRETANEVWRGLVGADASFDASHRRL